MKPNDRPKTPQPTFPRQRMVMPNGQPQSVPDAHDEPCEPMAVFARRTTPYSAEALERPVYGFRNGKTVKVAERLRDILTPEDIAAAGGSLPPDPRLTNGTDSR